MEARDREHRFSVGGGVTSTLSKALTVRFLAHGGYRMTENGAIVVRKGCGQTISTLALLYKALLSLSCHNCVTVI